MQFQVSYNVVDRGNLNSEIESSMKTYLPGDHNTNITKSYRFYFSLCHSHTCLDGVAEWIRENMMIKKKEMKMKKG